MEVEMYKEKIVVASTGEETLRDYDSNQIAEVEEAQIAEAQEAQTKAKAAAAKAALLEKLGITEEEAKLLLS